MKSNRNQVHTCIKENELKNQKALIIVLAILHQQPLDCLVVPSMSAGDCFNDVTVMLVHCRQLVLSSYSYSSSSLLSSFSSSSILPHPHMFSYSSSSNIFPPMCSSVTSMTSTFLSFDITCMKEVGLLSCLRIFCYIKCMHLQ